MTDVTCVETSGGASGATGAESAQAPSAAMASAAGNDFGRVSMTDLEGGMP
jgi:hypothetical protein